MWSTSVSLSSRGKGSGKCSTTSQSAFSSAKASLSASRQRRSNSRPVRSSGPWHMRQAYTLRTLILQGSAGKDESPEPPQGSLIEETGRGRRPHRGPGGEPLQRGRPPRRGGGHAGGGGAS